jgi:hypothetical protein
MQPCYNGRKSDFESELQLCIRKRGCSGPEATQIYMAHCALCANTNNANMNLFWLFTLLSAIPVAHSHLESNKFPGYGFAWYDPNCGYSCYNAVSSALLSCPSTDSTGGDSMEMDMDMDMTSKAPTPACKAQHLPFLETIAYCMSTRCGANIPVWKREEFWATKLLSDVVPKWTYSESLAKLGNSKPTMVYNSSSSENMTMPMLISTVDYEVQFKFNLLFDHLEMLQARYA